MIMLSKSPTAAAEASPSRGENGTGPQEGMDKGINPLS